MILRLLLVLSLLCPAARAATPAEAPAPSVLVTTIAVKSGAIPRSVTVYGTIGPGPGATDTLTLAYAGIVTKVDVVPGEAVHRGEALAVIGTAPATQAAYAQAEAAVRAAAQTLMHTRALVAAHLATTIQLAQAQQAETSAIAARNALRLDGAARPTATLTAPYDGVIAAVAAAPGASLQPGAPLITLLRTHALVATVGLDPSQAHQVHPGDHVAITPFATPAGRALRGRVIAIGAMVNPASGLVDATISMPATGYLVGESVTAEIDIGTARGVIVPRDAALPDGKHFQIWQIAAGHAHPVAVRIIARTASSAVVAGKLDPALPIVVTGNYQLQPGIAVRVTH
ncbi:efflux RND transporter periplasmic adaptor subunit [Acidiphilium sp. PA]|uniref:efflux RND transporter periplasmic adaptor subunit n=1 Tax=Acidiphilium sp. PA TaxID=2871705 RepID=UPI002243072E|nr:efflux RND transporter periplasmic adaptor subunit [Acidiphilium sp. PA]MCW8307610.1 efflux RND transporter periplasmic adaptor subunit [Acidiphilium sp. PA]